jgi:hypothetical protein
MSKCPYENDVKSTTMLASVAALPDWITSKSSSAQFVYVESDADPLESPAKIVPPAAFTYLYFDTAGPRPTIRTPFLFA